MSIKRATPLRIAVLASGRGSNLQAIIDGIEAGQVPAQLVAVISNKQDAVALERARKHAVQDIFIDPKPFAGRPDSREAYDRALLDVLGKLDVELVLYEDCDRGSSQRVYKSDDEHSSFAPSLVSRFGRPAKSHRVGMQAGGVHRPFRDGRGR